MASNTKPDTLPAQYNDSSEAISSVDVIETEAENDSDDISLFEFVEKEGDGALSKLCNHCQSMLDNWNEYEKNEDFEFHHHKDLVELEKAALESCALCYQFWRNGSSEIQDAREAMNAYKECGIECESARVSVRDMENYRPMIAPVGRTSQLELRFLHPITQSNAKDRLANDDFSREIISFGVMMFPTRYCASSIRLSRTKHGNTSDSLTLAARWLKRCRKSHWKCTDSDKSFMPTRLVCINQGAMHVCLGKDIIEATEYATLSHCWGEMTFVTLSRNNIGVFQTQIPQEALSRTVMEAINIARQLGFSYIWIDTLCIIQDDPDDWKHESSLMSAVYGGSGLKIAASGARDGNDGCFFDRPQHWRCQAEVQIHGLALRHNFVTSSFNYTNLSSMPLMRRGWAFQERLLASRTLHFSKTELFWECQQKSACDSFPEGLPWQCILSSDRFAKQPLVPSMWSWIVEQYSSCRLTFAISGLAWKIQEQTKDQYVAGMWRDTLEFQLCWNVVQPSKPRETGLYIAPTWSWASVDSPVCISMAEAFNESKLNKSIWISIIAVYLRSSGPDQVGPISSGIFV